MCTQSLSCVRFFAAAWTVVCQAPLCMEFSRQEYWSGLPFPSLRDLLDPGIEPASTGFPSSSMERNLHQCRKGGFYPRVIKILWNRKLQPTPVFLPGKFHGQMSLAGWSPWGCRRVRHDWVTKQQLDPILFHISAPFDNIDYSLLIQTTSSLCLILYSQFSSVTHSCLTICDPMDFSTPDFPAHHQLLEPAQTLVHWVGEAIQPSHPLLSPSLPAFNPL